MTTTSRISGLRVAQSFHGAVLDPATPIKQTDPLGSNRRLRGRYNISQPDGCFRRTPTPTGLGRVIPLSSTLGVFRSSGSVVYFLGEPRRLEGATCGSLATSRRVHLGCIARDGRAPAVDPALVALSADTKAN